MKLHFKNYFKRLKKWKGKKKIEMSDELLKVIITAVNKGTSDVLIKCISFSLQVIFEFPDSAKIVYVWREVY